MDDLNNMNEFPEFSLEMLEWLADTKEPKNEKERRFKLLINKIYIDLYVCWRERVKTKKYSRETFDFEHNGGYKIMEMAYYIGVMQWKASGYKAFPVFHPSRIINAPVYGDRIVEQWATLRYIISEFQDKLLYENMACQEGKGLQLVIKYVKKMIHDCQLKYGTDFWFLQYDMQGYFDNMSHDKILELFSGIQKRGLQIYSAFLDSFEIKDSYAAMADPSHKHGIPKGCFPSQWSGIVYLNDLDHRVHEREDCESQIRFMDDSVMLFKTKESCIDTYRFIESYLRDNKMGIRMHPGKTAYAPITRGFNFCGWHFEIKQPSEKILVRLKQSKKKEMLERLGQWQKAYEKGNMTWAEVTEKMRGVYNYLENGDTYRLRQYISHRFVFTKK